MAGLLDGTEVYIVPSSGPEIPLEFMSVVTVDMSRGPDADSLKFLTSDDRFDNIGAGPCTIRFRTPVDYGGGSLTFDWKGWYMSSIQPYPQTLGSFLVTMRDYRFIAAKEKVTASYNVQWPDEKKRKESQTTVGGAGGDWTVLDAAIDVLKKFGFEVDDKHVVSSEQRTKILLANGGNSSGGGWVSASLDEIIPAMLEQIRCDIVMTPEGKVRIVSRSGADDSPKLEAHNLIAGTVGERNIKWQKPKKIRVQFERLMEGVFEYTGASRNSSVVNLQLGLNMAVVNVMPEFSELRTTGEFIDLQAEVTRMFGPFNSASSADTVIGSRWYRPQLFPYNRDPKTRKPIGANPVAIARDIAIKSWYDDAVRQSWHRLFRVEPNGFTADSYARYFTNIRLGRLEKNGGTKDGGNVYCNYVKHLRWGVLDANAQDTSPLNNHFSENHHFGDPSNTDVTGREQYGWDPAPFVARWLSAEKLIFELIPNHPEQLSAKRIFPGTMARHLSYGPLFRLVNSQAIAVTEVSGSLLPDFSARVIWNGRLSRDLPDSGFAGGEGAGRVHEVEVDGFPDGIGPDVVVRADEGTTANYRLTEAALKLPITGRLMNFSTAGANRELMNSAEIADSAAYIAEQVKQTYNQNRAGTATVEGVSALKAGIWTGGLIYKMSVVIGQDMNESVLVNYIVQPELRDIELAREKPGKAPRRAVEE